MLFQPKPTSRYDGVISALFDENGKLKELVPNSTTDDSEWVSEVRSLLQDLSGIYPDSGVDGLESVADAHFYDDAKPLFWAAIKGAGITCDRDAHAMAFDRSTVIHIIAIVKDMYRDA